MKVAVIKQTMAFFGLWMIILSASGCQDSLQVLEQSSSEKSPQKNDVAARVELTNPSSFARESEAILISYFAIGVDDGTPLYAIDESKEVPSQLIDSNDDGLVDAIVLSMSFDSAEIRDVEIRLGESNETFEKRTSAEISHKVGGEWVPHSRYPDTSQKEYVGGKFEPIESLTPPSYYTDHSNWIRYEGPGIESDKVGFRVYLDWRNGFDIFGKLTTEPVLQKVGQDGYQSYHDMQDWGMDILKVGSSLGSGGYGVLNDGKVTRVSDVKQRSSVVKQSGTLFSQVQIKYDQWASPNANIDLNAALSMTAGSRLLKVDLSLSEPLEGLVTGLVKAPDTSVIKGSMDITGKAYTYMATWGRQALDGAHLGMAIFAKKENVKGVVEGEFDQLVELESKGTPSSNNPLQHSVSYYIAAVWESESGISTQSEFEQYLEQQAEILTIPVRIRLKTTLSEESKEFPITADAALDWSEKLADSELSRKGFTYAYDGWDVHRQRLPKFEYDIVGIYPLALHQLGRLTKNPEYKEVIQHVTSSFVTEEGTLRRYNRENYNIDSVAPGRALLALYSETGLEKYKTAASELKLQLDEHPKTAEGAFWHKKIYPHQVWLDGVYMGMPFLAEYSRMFEEGASYDMLVKEFVLTEKHLKDNNTGLYYHAWDEQKAQSWADPDTGLSPEFWGRGVGWLAMALVDVLEILPQDTPAHRKPLIDMSRNLAAALTKYQDPDTGTWWQVMDKPYETGNYRESSATAMFVYFLATAVEKGYIEEKYKDVAILAYEGLIREFVNVHSDGTISMTSQCYVAGLGFGRNGTYAYYMSEPIWENDPKGTAPFILAGMAVHKLLKSDS